MGVVCYNQSMKKKPASERLAEFYQMISRPVDQTECWQWTGKTNTDGYGYSGMIDGNRIAHRIMYTLAVGPIPAGMCVLHHCDNRGCVNPSHLFIGTRGDNNRDRNQKGRTVGSRCYGLMNGKATLTDEQVAEIRRLYTPGHGVTDLAQRFGVHRSTVINIAAGRRRQNSFTCNIS